MYILSHELRRDRTSLLIWTAVICFMLGICVVIYPEMSSQMDQMSEMFADMGSFTAAFGMDQLNFGEFMGYFGIECGNVLGLGGAFFAAILGISALAKEERDGTAEFLLTHPVSRVRVITEKLLSVFAQILIMNAVVIGVSVAAIVLIGESPDWQTLMLLFLAYLILQLEIASVTFGISAFLRSGALGIGIGLAVIAYFMNILSNLTEEVEFLKYITPFGYAESGYIINEKALDGKYVAVGIGFAVAGIAAAYIRYSKKDIH